MKKETKLELESDFADIRIRFTKLQTSLINLSEDMTGLTLGVGAFDRVLNKLEDAEVHTELIKTEETTQEKNKISVWAIIVGILSVCMLIYAIINLIQM